MGLMDKKAADWTARDAVNVWSLTWIFDVFKILLAIPFLSSPKRTERTDEEILQAQRDDHRAFRD